MKTAFLNRHGELRSGWRVALFLCLTIVLLLLAMIALRAFNVNSMMLDVTIELIGVLAATILVTRFINKKPFTAVGIALHPAMFREFGVGLLIGWLLMSGIIAVELLSGYVTVLRMPLPWMSLAGIILQSAFLFFAGAAFEELLFRGYILQSLMTGVTFLPAMAISSLLFLLGHGGNPHVSVFGLINIGCAGVMLSFAYLKTRSLWLPIGVHFAWNFSQTTLYGFPTSGNDFDAMRVLSTTVTGPEWITGGTFGPEGGFLATIAMVIGTTVILKWRSLTVPEGIITLDSIEDLLPLKNTNGEATA